MTFVSKAADRKLYFAGTNVILSQGSNQLSIEEEHSSRRTLINLGPTRPRLPCEDLIRQSLLLEDTIQVEDEQNLESDVESINLTSEENIQTKGDSQDSNE